MYLLSSVSGERGAPARLFHGRSADTADTCHGFPRSRSGAFRRDADDGTRFSSLRTVGYAASPAGELRPAPRISRISPVSNVHNSEFCIVSLLSFRFI